MERVTVLYFTRQETPMRFGIMDMQIGALVPAGVTPDRAMQHVSNFTQAKLVRELANAGFKLIELGGDLPLFFPQAFGPRDIQELRALKQELGLSYTVHLPLWSVEPSTPNQAVRQGSVHALVAIINATQPLEPESYAMHATGALAAEFYQMRLPEMARTLILQQFAQNAIVSLRTILAEAGIPSRRLAVETIEFPFELLMQIAETVDTSITLDTGHVLAGFSGPVGLFDALERILPRLGEIHLHDAPWQGPEHKLGYGKDHQALGKGDLDLDRFLDVLTAATFSGPIILELTLPEAVQSLAVIKKTRPEAIDSNQ